MSNPTYWPSRTIFRWLRHRREDVLRYLEAAGDFAECYPSFCRLPGAVRRADDGGHHWNVNADADAALRAAILSGRLKVYTRQGAEVFPRQFEGAGQSRPWPEFGCRRADVLRLWPANGAAPARPGRPPAEYWSSIRDEALRWLDYEGAPQKLSELEAIIARLAADAGQDPGEATVRRYAKNFIAEHRHRRGGGS